MSSLVKLVVQGYRGVRTPRAIEFASPNGDAGSGLTVLVGSNNSGKSTFIEALRHVHAATSSFAVDKRNIDADSRVRIELVNEEGDKRVLQTNENGGSMSELQDGAFSDQEILVLPSRRSFSPNFSDHGLMNRRDYTLRPDSQTHRAAPIDRFSSRLFKLQKNKALRARFDHMLGQVLSPVPSWTIDQASENQYFLSLQWPNAGAHTSDGAGEGVISLFFIVDSLCDAADGAMVAIDEPELSLHPAVQRRLVKLLNQEARRLQIVYTTHSPYFISWEAFAAGGRIVRIYSSEASTRVAQPEPATLQNVAKLRDNLNNPHTLGLDANEVFFLDDRIILLEGQEDVIFFRKVADQLGVNVPGTLFGWGAAGEGNMAALLRLFRGLEYERVAVLLDNNVPETFEKLSQEFPYKIIELPASDIRTKPERERKEQVDGLLDRSHAIRPELLETTKERFQDLTVYMSS